MKHELKKFVKEKYIYFLFTIFISTFLIISAIVFRKQILEFDLKIYEFLVLHRNNFLNAFFTTITTLGNAFTLIVIAILSIIFFKNKNYKILIPINLTVIGLLNYILKHVFLRQRPNNLRLLEESGYSFPSGHAMASTAFYGLYIYIIYKNINNKKIRDLVCILLSLLILFIDISRVYVGVHYATDVLAGTCFSIAYLIIILKQLNKNKIL